MKNYKLNMIVYFLAGVVITLLVITIVLLVLKSNEKKYETVVGRVKNIIYEKSISNSIFSCYTVDE